MFAICPALVLFGFLQCKCFPLILKICVISSGFFFFLSLQNEMEGQYGEHYAQKVEDRLLHYLNELETMLPGKTHVDEVCVLEKNVSMEGTFTSLCLYFLESLLNYDLSYSHVALN